MALLGGRPVPLHKVQTTAVQVCAFPAQGRPSGRKTCALTTRA